MIKYQDYYALLHFPTSSREAYSQLKTLKKLDMCADMFCLRKPSKRYSRILRAYWAFKREGK